MVCYPIFFILPLEGTECQDAIHKRTFCQCLLSGKHIIKGIGLGYVISFGLQVLTIYKLKKRMYPWLLDFFQCFYHPDQKRIFPVLCFLRITSTITFGNNIFIFSKFFEALIHVVNNFFERFKLFGSRRHYGIFLFGWLFEVWIDNSFLSSRRF